MFSKMAEVYAGFSEYIDAQVGRIIDYLEQTGQLEHTIVVGPTSSKAEAGALRPCAARTDPRRGACRGNRLQGRTRDRAQPTQTETQASEAAAATAYVDRRAPAPTAVVVCYRGRGRQ